MGGVAGGHLLRGPRHHHRTAVGSSVGPEVDALAQLARAPVVHVQLAAGAAAAASLGQLQQRNAALYNLFVQQQLLAAHALLATAGLVLSQRLPAVQATPVR